MHCMIPPSMSRPNARSLPDGLTMQTPVFERTAYWFSFGVPCTCCKSNWSILPKRFRKPVGFVNE